MYIVKNKSYKEALRSIASYMLNVEAGSEMFRDGVAVDKPAPGFPRYTRNNTEYVVRAAKGTIYIGADMSIGAFVNDLELVIDSMQPANHFERRIPMPGSSQFVTEYVTMTGRYINKRHGARGVFMWHVQLIMYSDTCPVVVGAFYDVDDISKYDHGTVAVNFGSNDFRVRCLADSDYRIADSDDRLAVELNQHVVDNQIICIRDTPREILRATCSCGAKIYGFAAAHSPGRYKCAKCAIVNNPDNIVRVKTTARDFVKDMDECPRKEVLLDLLDAEFIHGIYIGKKYVFVSNVRDFCKRKTPPECHGKVAISTALMTLQAD